MNTAVLLARQRPPPLDRPRGRLPGAAHDRPRHDDRQRRAAGDPARPALHPGQPHLGHQRLPDHVRQLPAARRSTRRPARAQARLPRRHRRIHRRFGALRRWPRPGIPDRGALHPGLGRRAVGLGDPRHRRDRVPGGERARQGDERLRVRGRRRRLARPARRRRAHAGPELALDLLRQPPDRHHHVRAREQA